MDTEAEEAVEYTMKRRVRKELIIKFGLINLKELIKKETGLSEEEALEVEEVVSEETEEADLMTAISMKSQETSDKETSKQEESQDKRKTIQEVPQDSSERIQDLIANRGTEMITTTKEVEEEEVKEEASEVDKEEVSEETMNSKLLLKIF